MAKIDTITLNVHGVDHKYNINVGKAGIFKCIIGANIADLIGYDNNKFESKDIDELRRAINGPYNEWIKSTKTEETIIWIDYRSSGCFNRDSNDYALHGPSDREFSVSSWAGDPDAIAFDFGVYIKETSSTGNVVWYNTQKGQGTVYYDEADLKDSDTYYKNGQAHGVSSHNAFIPYSKEAMDTLEKAREGIRSISEILYNLITSDAAVIEQLLTGGNLLLQPDNETS